MTTFKQYEPFILGDFTEDVFRCAFHRHAYSTIIYIYEGEGIHHLNNSQIPYKTGDLFVIGPDDFHEFRTNTQTRFIYLKFTSDFFHRMDLSSEQRSVIEAVMRSNRLKEFRIEMDEEYRLIVRHLIDSLLIYYEYKNQFNLSFPYHIVCNLIEIIREVTIGEELIVATNEEQLISYIQQHIYTPSLVRIQTVAFHFHIARNYFGTWFKRIFGISYREYILNYRLTLIKKRLKETQYAIKEIATEFGFADESHFSRYFRVHLHQTPSEYRKK